MSSNNDSQNRRRASELLSDLAAIIDAESTYGSEGLGERVASRIAIEWGGQPLYLPMDKVRRDGRIFAQFNGANYHELARTYRLSENTVRRIIAAERARRRHRQMLLPGVRNRAED